MILFLTNWSSVTQNPTSSHSETSSDKPETNTENEYVRLNKFAQAKQQDHVHDQVDGTKAPSKPSRPASVTRGSTGQSAYMNVTTQPPPQDGNCDEI